MIRLGVIGSGQISHGCCREVRAYEDISLQAVADPNGDRLASMAKQYGFVSTFSDGYDLIADKNVDAVYIAVPNKFHAPLAEAALLAGKHVILDKPFALNLDEAKKVAKAAKQSGKIFMLGMNQRFQKTAFKYRKLVLDGKLGEIYHAKAYWYRRTGIPKLGTWFGQKSLAGGGCMLDIGVHLLDLGLFVTDNFSPVSVSGNTYTKFGNRGLGEGGWGMSERSEQPFDVDDFASAHIKFKNGMSLGLSVSWACHQQLANSNEIELFGTEAGAKVNEDLLFKYGTEKGEYQVVQSPSVDTGVIGTRFRHFFDVIQGKAELLVTIEQALAVQKILDGIYTSSATGREVQL